MYDPESAAASRRGRQNRSEGAEFEKLIERSCEMYRAHDVAYIEKTPEPFKVERSIGGGKFIGHYEKQAQPDFKGTLKGGKTIVFDAKATITDRLQLSVLSDTQKESLETHSALGAQAFILIGYGFKRFYLMPADIFLSAKEINGHKYWTADEAEKMTRALKFNGMLLYFLGEA